MRKRKQASTSGREQIHALRRALRSSCQKKHTSPHATNGRMLLPVNMDGYAVSTRWIGRGLLRGLLERIFRLRVPAHHHRRHVCLMAPFCGTKPYPLSQLSSSTHRVQSSSERCEHYEETWDAELAEGVKPVLPSLPA